MSLHCHKVCKIDLALNPYANTKCLVPVLLANYPISTALTIFGCGVNPEPREHLCVPCPALLWSMMVYGVQSGLSDDVSTCRKMRTSSNRKVIIQKKHFLGQLPISQIILYVYLYVPIAMRYAEICTTEFGYVVETPETLTWIMRFLTLNLAASHTHTHTNTLRHAERNLLFSNSLTCV